MNERMTQLLLALGIGVGLYYVFKQLQPKPATATAAVTAAPRTTTTQATAVAVPQPTNKLTDIATGLSALGGAFANVRCMLNDRFCGTDPNQA